MPQWQQSLPSRPGGAGTIGIRVTEHASAAPRNTWNGPQRAQGVKLGWRGRNLKWEDPGELEARQKDLALSGLASGWCSRIPDKLCAVLLWSAALPQHHGGCLGVRGTNKWMELAFVSPTPSHPGHKDNQYSYQGPGSLTGRIWTQNSGEPISWGLCLEKADTWASHSGSGGCLCHLSPGLESQKSETHAMPWPGSLAILWLPSKFSAAGWKPKGEQGEKV